MFERCVRHNNIHVTKILVEDATQPVGTKQCRIALDERVQPALFHEVCRNTLYFLRRAAVHRRERNVVRQSVRNVEIVGVGIVGLEQFEKPVHMRPDVLRFVEEPLHVGLSDSRKVVADAEVEHDIGRLTRKAESPVQRMDQDPGTNVLLKRLVNLEFL